jgi:hypothetical protein
MFLLGREHMYARFPTGYLSGAHTNVAYTPIGKSVLQSRTPAKNRGGRFAYHSWFAPFVIVQVPRGSREAGSLNYREDCLLI